jgi:hypothetical protein
MAERAESVLRSVRDALALPQAEWFPDGLVQPETQRAALQTGLDHGYAGLALFWCAMAAVDERAERIANDYITCAIAALESVQNNASLYEGFTGVAYAVEVLRSRFPSWFSDEEDVNAAVDSALIAYLEELPAAAALDLTMGLTGIGMYFVRRLPRPAGRKGLELVARTLADRALRSAEGAYWQADTFTLARRRGFVADIGIAHGVPGLIGLLLHATRFGIPCAADTMESAVGWLLAQRRLDALSMFPYMWGEQPAFAERQGWCYGDLSIAIVLLRCGEECGVPAWTSAGLDAARRAAAAVSVTRLSADAGFCHGTSGVAHMFNRLFHFTRDGMFKDAALRWMAATFARWHPDDTGVGGFKCILKIASSGFDWFRNPGVLTGTAGIGLTLQSALDDEPPLWDEIFLIDLPTH